MEKQVFLRVLRRKRLTSNSNSKYQPSPERYANDILKVTLTEDQSTSLTSIRDNRFTLVKASHATGKTFTANVAANWWYDCWTSHICYITAPTWPQALGLTFKAVKTQRRESRLPGIVLDSGLIRDEDKLREGSHYIRALNAERGEGFQGEHEAPILIIIEEGVGVPKYIWDAAMGLMTHPECRLFVIGNPTDEATEFGTAAQSGKYNVITVSGLDHPNIRAELQCQPSPFPKAISLTWLYEMLVNECERVDHATEDVFEFHALPEIQNALNGRPASGEQWLYMPTASFQGRVLGEFPTQADQQVIPRSWLKFQPVLKPEGMPQIGCDIARFGDDRTTIFVRQGACALSCRELRKMDNLEVEAALKDTAQEAAKLVQGEAKKLKIKIDVTGGLGTGPYDHLKAEGYNVIPINSSEKAHNPEQYKNKRSELWFQTRFRARDKRLDLSRLRKDVRAKLENELSAPKYKSPGQKEVEKKADMKKRLGFSPDLADGCNLAYYEGETKGRFWNA